MIYVLNRHEQVVAILTNNGSPNSCPYYDDVMKESLDTGMSSYEFKVPSNHNVTDLIEEGGYVARTDLDGNLVMFTIMHIEETHGATSEIFVYAETAGMELLNDIVRPATLYSKEAEYVLDFLLQDTRWERGHVDYFGVENFSFEEYKNVVGTLQDVANTFGGELQFRIKMKNGVVSHRYVDLLEQRGKDTKKRFVYGKDIQSIKRTIDMSNVATALIGIGTDGLTFKTVGYYKSNGNPFTKPVNQDWVGDEDALQRYGTQGKHIFGTFTYETSEPETLLKKTWAELQKRKNPQISYEMDVSLLERMADIEEEAVRLGDTVFVVDTTFSPALYLEARVRELETCFSDPGKDRCVLGNFKVVKSNITSQMRAVQMKLLKKEATWDTVKDALDVATQTREETKPIVDSYYDGSFQNGSSNWSQTGIGQTTPPAQVGTVAPSQEADFGANTLQLQGEQTLFSKNAFPISTSRTYKVAFRVRQIIDPTVPGTSGVLVGVACLDENYNDITGGTHRFFVANNVQLAVADDWQVLSGTIVGEGTDVGTFPVGTKFVRPVFTVNYQNGDGTTVVDYFNFEDVTAKVEMDNLLNELSIRTEKNALIQTVMESEEYKVQMGQKVDTTYVKENFVDNETLSSTVSGINNSVDDKIAGLEITALKQRVTDVETKAGEIDFKFTHSGGVNLLKNSVGFAGTDFWTPISGTIYTLQNDELAQLGGGSGWWTKVGTGASLEQAVSVPNSNNYTLSFFMNKTADNATDGRVGIEIYGEGKLITFMGKDAGQGTTKGYEQFTYTLDTELNEVTVRIVAGTGAEAVLTNVMFNMGQIALQWTLASGEVYNTNVKMDMNGIRVNSNSYKGYTAITPQEFSGYAEVPDENNKLVMTRVFSLNKDVTEVSKLDADKEISMSPVKIVPVQSTSYTGWAFIALD